MVGQAKPTGAGINRGIGYPIVYEPATPSRQQHVNTAEMKGSRDAGRQRRVMTSSRLQPGSSPQPNTAKHSLITKHTRYASSPITTLWRALTACSNNYSPSQVARANITQSVLLRTSIGRLQHKLSGECYRCEKYRFSRKTNILWNRTARGLLTRMLDAQRRPSEKEYTSTSVFIIPKRLMSLQSEHKIAMIERGADPDR